MVCGSKQNEWCQGWRYILFYLQCDVGNTLVSKDFFDKVSELLCTGTVTSYSAISKTMTDMYVRNGRDFLCNLLVWSSYSLRPYPKALELLTAAVHLLEVLHCPLLVVHC
jgi:hypothetical protein